MILAARSRRPPIALTVPSAKETHPMDLNIVILQPLVALIAGILILVVPRLLNYIVAIYLIVIGLSGLWPRLFGA